MKALLISLRTLIKQLARFFIAGGFATLVHWIVMAMLIQQAIAPLYATILGAMMGSVINYLFQFYWVFKAKKAHQHIIPSYISIVVLGWILNAGLFSLLRNLTQADISYIQFYTTLMVAAINFITYKRIVFHERTI